MVKQLEIHLMEEKLVELNQRLSAMMKKNGYGEAESILDEWNYVHDWGEGWKLTTAPTKDTEGTYTSVCTKCDATETKSVAREDYSAYDKALEDANKLLENENLTEAAFFGFTASHCYDCALFSSCLIEGVNGV